MSLAEYLEEFKYKITPRTSLILFTPLLEGISYLSANGPQFPQLVITDFGCCSADRRYGLQQPYRIWDTDREGNAALKY